LALARLALSPQRSSFSSNPNPVRNVEGWKNSGLPWSYKLDRKKIWFRD
jgi:hypothetical protein